ncbi:50S ribosomal protein L11 methyltransferase [Acuticoccus sp. M5D2P5]|uniref:50S ribosomal protein L11 methyltransferase n=1 Tax=Acuticoccus kalidii TaxID=2910977 RepID=UPI001F30C031|nr:50S ribosomal protein L11 methyltransferase [Acuticoccus kalidii]MCF3935458.1 50S ribosomal protein L11 methyltransferase [Acuticoccus kalidii]
MVTRAYCTIGVGDAFQKQAMIALETLDVLVDDGEPIVSVHRLDEDAPWLIDVLFQEADESAQHRFLSAARSLLPDLPPFEFDALAERDWVAESQRQLHPVKAGRFVIYGSHDRDKVPPSRWRIEIDAGRAFGTAHHATTKGCLMALERVAIKGPLGTVADVGTGSGVLAIAADRLDAEAVIASDIDPIAVRVAKRNVQENRHYFPIDVTVAAGPVAAADTVIANILARPLIAMAPKLAASALETLILSGLRTADVRRVRAAYLNRGFRLEDMVVIENWATLILKRRAPHTGPVRGLRGESWRPLLVADD